MAMKTTLVSLGILILVITACRKESFITSPDAQVNISADTIFYDTVFTSIGSVTQSFKVINENDQKLLISSVRLMGGAASAFRINVDGFPGPVVNDLEIAANDSLYVFIAVTVDPNTQDLPFVIRDSIEITYNGVKRLVQLEAWGQNAHFFRNKNITTNETWINDLPYVILGELNVDTNITLTIDKGCRIYSHADAAWLIDGTLKVNGLADTAERVYFRGDRLDEPYRDYPAAWPGIYFRTTSQDNVLNYAVIRNAFQGIGMEDPSPNANPKLVLNQCIIDNAYDAGIVAVNSSLQATNTLVSNCGINLLLVKGGDYQFTHCTVVSYSNSFILHRDPVLFVSNFIRVNNVPLTNPLNAVFRNCIFWGDNGIVDDEVIVLKEGSDPYNVLFDHVLYKVVNIPVNATLNQVINNQAPQFDSINGSDRYYDFRLKAGSPAIDAGTNAGIAIDLEGKPRPVGVPDLGAFEKQ